MKRMVFLALLAALPCSAASAVTNSPALDLARQLNNAFIEVAETVSPSVVVIRVAQRPKARILDEMDNPLWDLLPKEFRKKFEDEREKQQQESQDEDKRPGRPPVFDGQGSGVIIRDDGYILTNFHVVEDAEKIRVRLRDGRTFDATVRGTDAQSDIAVLKIHATNLPAAKLGDSTTVRVGEFAVAIGAPFDLDYSVTFGHVSAKGRSQVIPARGANSQGAKMDQDFIQTDASINPGNSGGPLVNLYGEVIGINTLIHGLHTGIGFAVPVNLAREVADKLIAEGKFSRSWLGIGIRGLREDEDYRELIQGVDQGVVVTELRPDGPASKSALKPGDVITSVDGRGVSTANQLRAEVRGKAPGSTVMLDVMRNRKGLKIKVRPEAWPESDTPLNAKKAAPRDEATPPAFGLKVEVLNQKLAQQFGLDETEGVVVTEVASGSVAGRKGMQPGDLITSVNQQPLSTPDDFNAALKKADGNKGVAFEFIRKGVPHFEVLRGLNP